MQGGGVGTGSADRTQCLSFGECCKGIDLGSEGCEGDVITERDCLSCRQVYGLPAIDAFGKFEVVGLCLGTVLRYQVLSEQLLIILAAGTGGDIVSGGIVGGIAVRHAAVCHLRVIGVGYLVVAVPVGLGHRYRLRRVELLAHFGSELDGLDRRGRDDVCGARPERAVVGEEVDEDVVVAMLHRYDPILGVAHGVVGLSVGGGHGRVVAVVLFGVGNQLVDGICQPIAVRFVGKELTTGVGVVVSFLVGLQDVPQHLLVAGERPCNE